MLRKNERGASSMIASFAPMEGITSHLYRRIHARFFPGVDRYYAPFLAPDAAGKVKASSLKELYPENNKDLELIPQILCNRPEAFLALSRELAAMGYREVNLNAGCPSGTVVPKHKGAGMLQDLRSLDAFLAEVFSHSTLRVTVKTRLGLERTDEFPAILDIYNAYPLSELVIHARARSGMYKSTPDLQAFASAFAVSLAPVCYNGNILDRRSYDVVMTTVPSLDRIMLGRGAVANPALFRELRGGPKLEKQELSAFLEEIFSAYLESGLGSRFSLGRMKEIWYYVNYMFPGAARELKRVNKAQDAADYRAAVSSLFASGLFDPDAAFPGTLPPL